MYKVYRYVRPQRKSVLVRICFVPLTLAIVIFLWDSGGKRAICDCETASCEDRVLLPSGLRPRSSQIARFPPLSQRKITIVHSLLWHNRYLQ